MDPFTIFALGFIFIGIAAIAFTWAYFGNVNIIMIPFILLGCCALSGIGAILAVVGGFVYILSCLWGPTV